ncbi:MAG: sulfotransferase [Halioglobus sp.]|nr:sulfotransferase [Halioglobus sp.]
MNAPQQPPGYIQLINAIGERLERMALVKPELSAEQLMKRAQQKTGLKTWGDDAFRPGLDQLIAALNTQAQLSQVGRITAYYNLLDHLCVRLRLNNYRATRPEVAAQTIVRPLFILGLPRTGTTILHELIAQDPSFRSPASWEVARPLPPPTAHTYNSDKRIATVSRLLRVLEKLTPGFQAIHALGAQLPQECVYMLASSFISEQFAYMYNVPDYRNWALEQDMTSAYAWHARFLQHLQVDTARERWVLKTPAHLAHLDYLLAQYPDAAIIWTHRRPLEAIASFSSLACTLRRGFSASADPVMTGACEFEYFSRVAHRGVTTRRTLDNGQFIDVSFEAICADPLSVVSAIYDRLGMPLTHEAQLSMREYLRRRPRNLYGEHQYSAQTFGLDAAQEQQLYSGYLSEYGAYLEGEAD